MSTPVSEGMRDCRPARRPFRT